MHDDFVRRCRPLLGTFVEIMAPASQTDAIAAAFAAMAHVHARMSFHEETSDLAALRRAQIGEAVAVDPETVAVLRVAADLYVRSNGLFDVSIGTQLVRTQFLPCPVGIDPHDMSGSAADIEIIDETHVRCRKAMLIDLGGIAKGHAVDRATEALRQAGVQDAVVNAGGDLRVLGERPQRIHLREADGTIGRALALADAALASSANLQNRDTCGGVTTSPHIGWNGKAIIRSDAVSIVASRCVIADAMTKIALVDADFAADILQDLGGKIVMRSRRAA